MIGATGMLRDAAIWVAARSNRLILVSRQNLSAPLFDLHNVQSVIADWREPKAFIQALKSVDGFSGTKLAVLWMHNDGSETKKSILGELSATECFIISVEGSAALSEVDRPKPEAEQIGENGRLVKVVLGAKETNSGKRWLTWPEISNGVIRAIKAEESQIVGTLP